MAETRTKQLPDGTTLRVQFHGGKAGARESDSVTIDGQKFRVGNNLDKARKIVAITDKKVQVEDNTSGTRRNEKRTQWYTHTSAKLVAIKQRGDKEGR